MKAKLGSVVYLSYCDMSSGSSKSVLEARMALTIIINMLVHLVLKLGSGI